MSDVTAAHSQALYLNERLRERVRALEAENAELRSRLAGCVQRKADTSANYDALMSYLARLNKAWLEAQQRATRAGIERTELFEREQAALAELGERQRECARLREALEQVKARVVGDKVPRWGDQNATTWTRGQIADICDYALGNGPEPAQQSLANDKPQG